MPGRPTATFFTPIQTNFTSGIFSGRLFGRTDLAQYSNALRHCYNFNLLAHGGANKRSGTRYINEVKDSSKTTKLIPFIFSTVQAYTLEFGDQYIRFYRDEGQILSGGSPYEISTPYLHTQLVDLRFAQSNDVLYLVHPLHRPMELSRLDHTSWTLTDFDFQDGPYKALNTEALTLTPSATAGSVTITASASLFASTDVDGWIRIRNGGGASWGAAQITAYISATQVTALVKTGFPFGGIGPTTGWHMPGWSDTVGWPSAQPTFFESRLCFANTLDEPSTFWISETENFNTFSPTDAAGVVSATNGMRRTIADNQVNAIFWLVSEKVLIAGTSSGPWTIEPATTIEPFGPANIRAYKENRQGAANTPVIFGDSVLYVSRSGLKLRELSFNFESDKKESIDISLLSEGITENSSIVEINYIEEPDNKITAVLSNGSFILVTYIKSQKVVAWHKHIIAGTNAKVKSHSTIPSVDSKTDTTYIIVERTINSNVVQYIEFFEEEYIPTSLTDHSEAFFIDSGLTYSGVSTQSIAGLDHLEGESVRVLVNGASHPDVVVSSGTITLTKPTTKAQIGLGYKAHLETLNIEVAQRNGSSQGRQKAISKVIVRLHESIGGMLGNGDPTLNQELLPARNVSDPTNIAPPLRSEDRIVDYESDTNSDGRIVIEQDLALPFTVLAIMPQVDILSK